MILSFFIYSWLVQGFEKNNNNNNNNNNLLVRAVVKCMREPVGLMRSGDQRPDGCTLVSLERGKCLSCHATIPAHLPSLTWATPALSQWRRPSVQQKSNMTSTKSSLAVLSSAPTRSRHWALCTRRVRNFWQTWCTGYRLCRAIHGRLLSFFSVYPL